MNAGSAERRDGGPVASSKITPRHLDRLAIVYVRQSHAIQLIKNPEATRVQYSLTEHAVGLGWSRERVLVIDEDQAHTATTSEGRLGFQRLVAEVGLGHVGIIVGFQMSRLARSCSDWYQLIDAVTSRGDTAGGLGGVLVPVAVGPEGAGDGAGGALTGDALHFFGRAFAEGFGVTSAPRGAGGKDAVISNEREIRRRSGGVGGAGATLGRA